MAEPCTAENLISSVFAPAHRTVKAAADENTHQTPGRLLRLVRCALLAVAPPTLVVLDSAVSVASVVVSMPSEGSTPSMVVVSWSAKDWLQRNRTSMAKTCARAISAKYPRQECNEHYGPTC